MSAPRFGHRLCVGRVIWYTRRVPWEIAADRRDELFSDLWEHAADSARRGEGNLRHQFSVIRRMLAGMPADLSWRKAARVAPEHGAGRCHRGFVELTWVEVIQALALPDGASPRASLPVSRQRRRRRPLLPVSALRSRMGRQGPPLGYGLLRFEDRERARHRSATRWPL